MATRSRATRSRWSGNSRRYRSCALDRTRVLQILVNLISNAKNAMEDMQDAPHRLTLRVDVAAGSLLRIQVIDDGEGIPSQNLTRIFAHGFTTRKSGHGFGLHSCALTARQMGGTLSAHSDGPGRGLFERAERN